MPIRNIPPKSYVPHKKSKAAAEGDLWSSPDNMNKRLLDYKRKHPEFRNFLVDRGIFIPTRIKVLQTNARLYSELGAAYTTYQLMRSHINRATGKEYSEVFDNLHRYYNRGLLVTSFVNNVRFGKDIGISGVTLGRHIQQLHLAGFLEADLFKGKTAKRARKTLLWFGWWTSGYKDSKNKVTEFYFEEFVDNVGQRIEDIKTLKKSYYTETIPSEMKIIKEDSTTFRNEGIQTSDLKEQ